jgi:hypothetical protein
MKKDTLAVGLLERVLLRRVDGAGRAGLMVCSLPLPAAGVGDVAGLSLGGRATYGRVLGQWPGEAEGRGRRLLMVADGGEGGCGAEETVGLSTASMQARARHSTPSGRAVPPGVGELPVAVMKSIARSADPGFAWERHCLEISFDGKRVGVSLGLRAGEKVKWWEACRMVVKEETEACRVVEMAGTIPLVENYGEVYREHPNLTHPFLHKHNWLNGKLMVRMHANAVCEVFAHHINSRFVDSGGDLAPAVPVVGFWDLDAEEAKKVEGVWDGTRTGFEVGGVKFDMSECAALATREQPGFLRVMADSSREHPHPSPLPEGEGAGRVLVWQAYEGFEMYGGACPRQRTGDAYILRGKQETILRGMARTLRFSISLGDRPAKVARYIAPGWWYGHCQELTPSAILPVETALQSGFGEAYEWLEKHTQTGGFEDGSVGRYMPSGRARPEPGWEGEISYAMFLQAWRTGDARWYRLAMRAAYHFADVAIDHSSKLVRMHGYPGDAYSLPMNRVQGVIAAFLETGDDYLFDASEAVLEAAYRNHSNSWPRLAVGRDACFARGAVMQWRYFANGHFKKIAWEGVKAVCQSQRENGSFGDQGGGVGIHQYSGYMTKPWMTLLAMNPVLDWLEVVGEKPELLEAVRRLADWLMAERVELNGVVTWQYLHDYNAGREWPSPDGKLIKLPDGNAFHHETIGRLLCFAAMRFEEPAYLEAWAESRRGVGRLQDDHPIGAALQFVPWVEERLVGAKLGSGGEVVVEPHVYAGGVIKRVRVEGPLGVKEVELSAAEVKGE